MDVLQALALGVIQGLTEFLPVSSSGHLVLTPWLLGWKDPGLTFDVALHMGTLIALLVYFWRDWVGLLGGLVRTISKRTITGDPQAKLFWLLVLASVPGAAVGALGESAAEGALRAPEIIAVLMIGLGVLLVIAELVSSRTRLLKQVGLADSILIGLSQAIAICPGVSRSGITISAGLFRGLTRDAAARFSFLMSAPIIAGAGIYSVRRIVESGMAADERLPFAVGFISAAVSGYVAIRTLLRFLQNHSLLVFAGYRFVVGAGVLAVALLGLR